MPRSSVHLAKTKIAAAFEGSPEKVFRRSDLARLLDRHRWEWGLPQRMSTDAFIEYVIDKLDLRKATLEASEDYAPLTRYVWGEPSAFELALSIRPDAYFSHGTAVFLNGLTDDLPKMLRVNKEQSAKPPVASKLSQASIDLAFSRKPRASRLVYRYNGLEFQVLSGKQTGNLDVANVLTPGGRNVPTTRVERTLIDITVRPHYAGGVQAVLDTYDRAREVASVSKLIAILRRLDYVYPYHQAIGWYMTRVGYPESRVARLKELGLEYTFYLQHGLREKKLDQEWNLFVPAGM